MRKLFIIKTLVVTLFIFVACDNAQIEKLLMDEEEILMSENLEKRMNEELEKMGMGNDGIIGTQEQWENFILTNTDRVKEILIYFNDGNIPNVGSSILQPTDNIIYSKEIQYATDYLLNNNINYKVSYKDDVGNRKYYDLIEPNDVVYEFLEYYALSRLVIFDNGYLTIQFRISDMGTELKYTGGIDGNIEDLDNWEIDYFGYGV